MKTRKIVYLICALILLLSFAACDIGGSETESETALNCESESSAPTDSAEESEDQTESNSPTSSETSSENVTECAHVNTDWSVTEAPTCSSTGSRDSVCLDCGAVLKTETVEKVAHSETIVKGTPATCTSAGLTDGKKCSACDTVLLEQAEIPIASHVEVVIKGTPPTCTEPGLTEGKKCSVCEEVLLEQSAIPATAHTEIVVKGKQPTCKEKGLTDGKKCSVCDTVILEQVAIPMVNHTEVIVKGYQPTCTESGMTDGKTCSVCNTVLVASEVIPALDHDEGDWMIDVPASSDAEGKKHTECTRCKEVINTASIPKIDAGHTHLGVEWLVSVPPTCTKEGVRSFVCECGETLETEAVACIPHTEVTLPSVASTCSKEGLTEGKQCSVCKEITVKQNAIDTLPHTEITLTGIAATCTSTGLTEGKQCSTCKQITVEQKVIDMAPHTEVTLPAIAATCTSSGLTKGKTCSVCKTVLIEQTPTAKVAHSEKTILGKPATCTESGISDGKVCSVCSTTIATQLYLPPTGHSFENGVCTGCGQPEAYGIWIVDGLGNPLSDIIIKVFKDGNQIKIYQYKGEYLTLDIARGNYTIELDLSMLQKSYDYDKSLLVLTPDKKNTTIRLFESLSEPTDSGYVGYPIEKDYDLYSIGVGSYYVDLTPNDYTFFVFRPTAAAVYTITYESDTDLKVSYHGGSFFIQGSDISGDIDSMNIYETGLAFSVYSGNVGGDMVFAVWSSNAESCVLNIENVGDPGTRLEDEPWTPYLEDDAMINKQLAVSKDGTYTAIDLTDMSVSAVFNAADGYYHLGSIDGPIIFIDLTTDSKYISSIQTICANQRMGAYIYDADGKVAEKRSYNELFIQYGMPSDTTSVDEPIRIPLTKKLAEAIREFGGRSGWWGENPDVNIFNKVLLGASYNQEYAWLLYCGIYE